MAPPQVGDDDDDDARERERDARAELHDVDDDAHD